MGAHLSRFSLSHLTRTVLHNLFFNNFFKNKARAKTKTYLESGDFDLLLCYKGFIKCLHFKEILHNLLLENIR